MTVLIVAPARAAMLEPARARPGWRRRERPAAVRVRVRARAMWLVRGASARRPELWRQMRLWPVEAPMDSAGPLGGRKRQKGAVRATGAGRA